LNLKRFLEIQVVVACLSANILGSITVDVLMILTNEYRMAVKSEDLGLYVCASTNNYGYAIEI